MLKGVRTLGPHPFPVPLPRPWAVAGDAQHPHAPALPLLRRGTGGGGTKKRPPSTLAYVQPRGWRWRAGRPCPIILAQAFQLVKPPFGGLPNPGRRPDRRARAALGRSVEPLPGWLDCGTPAPGGAGRKKRPRRGRKPRRAGGARTPEGRPPEGPAWGPQGAQAEGDPPRSGRAGESPQSRTGRPQEARRRPRATPSASDAPTEGAGPTPAGPARPGGRPPEGGRRRGASRSRATGAGGAAVARGHRSDP